MKPFLASRSLLAPISLTALAIALVSVIALEIGTNFRDSAPMTSSPPVPLPATPKGHSAAADAGQVAQWVATSLARPLFTPDRRPPAAAAAAATPEAGAAPLPRMAGTMITSGGRRAIFAGKGDKPFVVGEGARVGDFTVQSIAAGTVTLHGPDGVRVLKLSFDPDTPAPAPLAPPMPMGFPGTGMPVPASNTVPGLPGFPMPPQIPGLANPAGQVPNLLPRPNVDPRTTR